MNQSALFTKTSKAAPAGETSVNAILLERGGYVFKNSAGIYSWLPLGWRVIEQIARIIREEMNAIGGQEMFMPALVEKKYLAATGRWDTDVGFAVTGKRDRAPAFVLGWTHEEVLTAIAARFVNSYKDLPFAAYQIQTKFRNEPRAKSGLLRGREFLMKDLYSFHANEADLWRYYEIVKAAYLKIFARCGLQAIYTVAAGGDFTASRTHEFQVLAAVGEDTIFICGRCAYAENKEISKLRPNDICPKCDGKVTAARAIEVGNIFPLGVKYAQSLGLKFLDAQGRRQDVVMGSYGIGLGRVLGTIVEIHHDDRGIIWPASVAPFLVHLLELSGGKQPAVIRSALAANEALQNAKITVLYDDRAESPGVKFADSDLLGMPYRVVVSEKTIATGQLEVKRRDESKGKLLALPELIRLMRHPPRRSLNKIQN